MFNVAGVGDPAAVLVSIVGSEGHALHQMKLPVGFEGEVGLHGVRDQLSVLQQLDGDVGRVEVPHVADQGVAFSELSLFSAVHVHLG